MTTLELRRILGISQASVMNWIKEGMPATRTGYQYELNKDDVKAWLMERQQDSKFSDFYRILVEKL